MNPNLELETLLHDKIYDIFGEDNEALAKELHNTIRNWMDRNGIVFYQP